MINKIKKYGYIFLNPAPYLAKKNYILLVSHMRSRSTLLSHILGSNSEICGYKELHLLYAHRLSLLRMRVALANLENYDTCKYLLDKNLHNRLCINPSIFSGKLKLIILLREPVGTIASMLKMQQKIDKNTNFQEVVNYYKMRIAYLGNFGQMNKNAYLFVDSENLIRQTEKELLNISCYLEIKTPLQACYKKFSETGKPIAGDPSDNIKVGKIIKTEKAEGIPLLDGEGMAILMREYESCRAKLLKYSVPLEKAVHDGSNELI